MKFLLNLIPGFSFFRLGIVIALAVALSAAVWKIRHDGVKAGRAEIQAVMDADLAQRTAAQLAQEQANRAKEAQLNATITKQRNDYAKDLERRNHTALLVAGQLRDFQAVASQSSQTGTDSTTTSRTDDARTTVINECGAAVAAMDGNIERLTSKVTGLQSYVTDVCLR